MAASPSMSDSRVAIFIDCDNANPANLADAVQIAQRLGRLILRRGYGNQVTLGAKWQKALVNSSVTPCLQFQYAAGKNTADIALAIDLMEVLMEKRVDTFVLVTSDSDFVGLAQKIKERGASVHIVGEDKTPESLRNACDQFFSCDAPEPTALSCPVPFGVAATTAPQSSSLKALGRSYPAFVITELALLLKNRQVDRVPLASFGSHLRSINPSFGPKIYGHKKLSSMLSGYSPGIKLIPDNHGNYLVSQPQGVANAPTPAVQANQHAGSTAFIAQLHTMVSDAPRICEPEAPNESSTYAILD